MKQEITFAQYVRGMDKANARHNKIAKERKRLYDKWVNAQSDKKHDRLEKKLKRLSNKEENAIHAYSVAIRRA